MKTVKKSLFMFFVALVAVLGTGGCASGAASRSKQAAETGKATNRPEVIDDKGAAFGIKPPEWLTAYIMGGNVSVEALAAYKNSNCFVVSNIDPVRDMAVEGVNNANGPAEIAGMIAMAVNSQASNKLSGDRGAEVEGHLEQVQSAMSNASIRNARKDSDWWQIIRYPDGREEARAFALWVVDRKDLANQNAANIQNIIDNNKAMSAAERAIYADLIQDIRGNGFLYNSNSNVMR